MQSVHSVRAEKKKHPQNNRLVLKLSTVHLNLLLNCPPALICQKLLVNLRLANYRTHIVLPLKWQERLNPSTVSY